MDSPIIFMTAVESCFGFLLTGTILYLVLAGVRKPYGYLYAAFLLICMIWDLGTFVMMIRNGHVEELAIIGRAIIFPCILIPALIFHFSNLYTGRIFKRAIISIWVLTGITYLLIPLGVMYRIEGFYSYAWGNIFRVVPSKINLLAFVFWFGINIPALWLLYQSMKMSRSRLEYRHHLYVFLGFLAVTFAIVKSFVTLGIDLPFLLPIGMLLNDVFAAIIGIAIIKDRLFDITLIIQKGTLYSFLAALIIFVYTFSEHLLITYFGELVGEDSTWIHLLSIGAGIAVMMPLKNKFERYIDNYFAQRKLEF